MLRKVNDEGIILSIQQKIKKEGVKKPVIESLDLDLPFTQIKKATYDPKF